MRACTRAAHMSVCPVATLLERAGSVTLGYARRCQAGLHPATRKCVDAHAPFCTELMAELCPTGAHTVWRRCGAAAAPPCREGVLDECAGLPSGEKHVVQRRCHEARPACEQCALAAAAQERMQRHADALRKCAHVVWRAIARCKASFCILRRRRCTW